MKTEKLQSPWQYVGARQGCIANNQEVTLNLRRSPPVASPPIESNPAFIEALDALDSSPSIAAYLNALRRVRENEESVAELKAAAAEADADTRAAMMGADDEREIEIVPPSSIIDAEHYLRLACEACDEARPGAERELFAANAAIKSRLMTAARDAQDKAVAAALEAVRPHLDALALASCEVRNATRPQYDPLGTLQAIVERSEREPARVAELAAR